MTSWEIILVVTLLLVVGLVAWLLHQPGEPSNVVPLSATLTGTGELTTDPRQVEKHLVERVLAELDDGDVDGAKQAAIRLLAMYTTA